MLKTLYGEECLSRTCVFEWHRKYKETQKLRMQKSRVKTMLTAFFYVKGTIHHIFVPEKQTVNGKFYKDVMKRLIARVQRVKLEFQESGTWCLLHDNALVQSSGFVYEFLAKRGISVLSHPAYSSDLAPDDFFIS
jgi:hypothetical protein